MPMQPQAQAQPMPQQPEMQGADEGQGPQRVKETEFNQGIQNVIFSRIEEEYAENPNFGEAIENGLTPEAAMEIGLVIPEILPLLRSVGLIPNDPSGGPIQQGDSEQNAGPMPPQQNQSGNPLTEDQEGEDYGYNGISRGLMG